jgi:hypothetical protein
VCKIGAPALVGSVTGTPQLPLFLAPGWPRSPASTSSSGTLGPAALLYETGPSSIRPVAQSALMESTGSSLALPVDTGIAGAPLLPLHSAPTAGRRPLGRSSLSSYMRVLARGRWRTRHLNSTRMRAFKYPVLLVLSNAARARSNRT